MKASSLFLKVFVSGATSSGSLFQIGTTLRAFHWQFHWFCFSQNQRIILPYLNNMSIVDKSIWTLHHVTICVTDSLEYHTLSSSIDRLQSILNPALVHSLEHCIWNLDQFPTLCFSRRTCFVLANCNINEERFNNYIILHLFIYSHIRGLQTSEDLNNLTKE